MGKIKCRNCKKVIKSGDGYTCSLAKSTDRFCDQWCVEKFADKYFKLKEKLDNV